MADAHSEDEDLAATLAEGEQGSDLDSDQNESEDGGGETGERGMHGYVVDDFVVSDGSIAEVSQSQLLYPHIHDIFCCRIGMMS